MASEDHPGFFYLPDEELAEIRRSLEEGESDRGAALVGTALLDDLLSEILKAYFVDDPKRASYLLGIKQDGPLGTFSSKIKTCYILGLIGSDIHDDLNYIRKVRNEFAHSRSSLDFENPTIKILCEKLTISNALTQSFAKRGITATARMLFVCNTLEIYHVMSMLKHYVDHRPIGKNYTIERCRAFETGVLDLGIKLPEPDQKKS